MSKPRGWRPFWPELEPRKRPSRYVWCIPCGGNGIRSTHLSSRRHQRATYQEPTRIIHGERPTFVIALRGDDEGTPAQNLAAARRLGITV